MVELDQLNIHSSREIIARHGLTLPELFDLSLEFYKEEQHQFHLTYEQKNQLAAYFRQSTLGPYSPEKLNPGYFDFVGNDRKKAWEALGEISSNGAMAGFCNLLETVCPDLVPWIRHKKRERENKKKEEKSREEERLRIEEAERLESSKLINIVKRAEEIKIEQSKVSEQFSDDEDEEMPSLERNDRSVSGSTPQTSPSQPVANGETTSSTETSATETTTVTETTSVAETTTSVQPESDSQVPVSQFESCNGQEPVISVKATNGETHESSDKSGGDLNTVNDFIETISESESSATNVESETAQAQPTITESVQEDQNLGVAGAEANTVGPEALNAVLRQHFACMLYLKQMKEAGHMLTVEQEAYLVQMAPYEDHINSLKSRVEEAVETQSETLGQRETPAGEETLGQSETPAGEEIGATETKPTEPVGETSENETSIATSAVESQGAAKNATDIVSTPDEQSTASSQPADIQATSQESFAVISPEQSLEVVRSCDMEPEVRGGLVTDEAGGILAAEVEGVADVAAPPLPVESESVAVESESVAVEESAAQVEKGEAFVAAQGVVLSDVRSQDGNIEIEAEATNDGTQPPSEPAEVAVDQGKELNEIEETGVIPSSVEQTPTEPSPTETVSTIPAPTEPAPTETAPTETHAAPEPDSKEVEPTESRVREQEADIGSSVENPSQESLSETQIEETETGAQVEAHCKDNLIAALGEIVSAEGNDIAIETVEESEMVISNGEENEMVIENAQDNKMVMSNGEENEMVIENEEPAPHEESDNSDAGEELEVWQKTEVAKFITIVSKDSESVLSVGRGETVTVRIPTYESGTALYWEFATENYDIGFGASFEWEERETELMLDQESSAAAVGESGVVTRVLRQPILPILRRSSHEKVITGSHAFPRSGTYLLMFDNSYSLLRSKTVFYRVFYTK